MKSHIILLTLAAAVVGCTDLTLPGGAQVSCGSDADCPGGFVCRAEVERCIDAGIIGKTPIAFSAPPTLTPTRVSAAPGFNTVTVTASLSEEPVDAPSVTVVGKDFSCEGTREIVCTLNVVDADLQEGTFEVQVAARDAAANVAGVVLPLIVDLTPPSVADAPPALLEAAPDNPITRPTAMAFGTTARVTVSLTELLGVEPTARLAGTDVTLTRIDADGLADTAFTFGWTFAPGDVVDQGPRPVALTLQDAVGNTATVEIDVGLVVDTIGPAAPAVDVEGAVIYRRAPWGGVESQAPAFSVVGTPGREGGLLIEARSLDGPGALILGRAVSAADGAFDVPLLPVDLPRVFLVAWDPAGNPSAPVRVRDVAWTAAFGSKLVASRLENPHTLFAAPRFSGASLAPSLTEIDPAPLFTPDASVTVAGGGAWERRRLNGTSPPTFGNMALAYHAGLGRVVSFGGAVNGDFLPLDGTATVEGDDVVTLPLDTRPPPGPARMAYDGRRDRLVLVPRNDRSTWVFEDLRWRRLDLSGPAPKSVELAYDPTLDLIIGFEALGAPTTWLFDGVAWTALETPEPGQRNGHVLVWDDVDGRVLLHGGGPGPPEAVLGDVWAFTGTTWTQVGVGPALRDHVGFTGPDGTMWVVGGARPHVRETEQIDTNQAVFAWRGLGSDFETITTGPPPGGRRLGAQLGAAWDVERDRLVTLGGGTTTGLFGVVYEPQMHVFQDGAWRRLDSTPRPRIGSRADLPPLLFDPARGGLLVAGGVILGGAAGVLFDTQVFAGDSVTSLDEDMRDIFGGVTRTASLFRTDSTPMLVATGAAALLGPNGWSPVAAIPPGLEGMAAGFLESDNVAILFGGTNGAAQDDTVRFTTAGGFQTLAPARSPPARHGAAMTWDDGRQRLVLFGGVDGPTAFTDTWSFDGSDWSPVATSGPPVVAPTLVYDETRGVLVLVGTIGERVVVHELLDETWQPRVVVGIDGRRVLPAAGFDPVAGRIVLHGGVGVQGTVDETFLWDGSPGLRGAVVAQLDLRARGAAAGAVVTALSIEGSAGARGFADATAVPGAQVMLWRGRWEVLGENTGNVDAPAPFTSSSTDPGLLGLLDPDLLHIAVAPRAPHGHRRADVALGAFAVTLGYREP